MPERWRCALAFGALVLAALPALALDPGQSLPALRVEKLGELQVEGDELQYTAWDSARLSGKIHVLQYLAARPAARNLSKPFTDRLEKSGIPLAHYHVTTIVNLDDAMFGTRGFVLSELERNKRRYHLSTIVADESGAGRLAWGLQGGSSAVIILGPDARVLFFREGAMSEGDIEQALEIVRSGSDAVAAR